MTPHERARADRDRQLQSLGQLDPEFRDRVGDCRFGDCRHGAEPDCAVKNAVAEGDVSGRRYESYKRIVNLTDQLSDARRP